MKQKYLEASQEYLDYLAERIFKSIDSCPGWLRGARFESTNKNLTEEAEDKIQANLDKLTESHGNSPEEIKKFLNQFNDPSIKIKTSHAISRDCLSLINKYLVFKHECLPKLENNDLNGFKAEVKKNEEVLLKNTGSAGMNLFQALFKWVSNKFFENNSQKIVNLAEEENSVSLKNS